MNIWIFQSVPKEYDVGSKMKELDAENWRVTRYFRPVKKNDRSIKRGDVVYFWEAGKSGGIYGWGYIQSDEPYLTDDGNYRARVSYEESFENPIPRTVILDSALEKLQILRAPQGTNFKVELEEAVEINRLIIEAGYIAPSLEEGTR